MLELGVGETVTEGEGRGHVVLIVPSIAEVVLLGVSRVPAIVITRELRGGHILLIVNVWHRKGKLRGRVNATEHHIHEGGRILLSRKDIEEDRVSILSHVGRQDRAWRDHATDNFTWVRDKTQVLEDDLVPTKSCPVVTFTRR